MMESMQLTPTQEQEWQETVNLFGWRCPGFRHLMLRLLVNNNGKYGAVMAKDFGGANIAATDGKNIIINPEKFFELTLLERLFALAHEVMHNVYNDVNIIHRHLHASHIRMNDGTELPYDADTLQRAMDYRINAMLVESKIGRLNKNWLYDKAIACGTDHVLDAYAKLYKRNQQNGGKGGGNGQVSFDQLLPPGTSTGQPAADAAGQRNQQRWQIEVAAAQVLEQMRTQGNLPGALKRMFETILEPKIRWTDRVQSVLRRVTGSGGYNWNRPDRRHIVRDLYLPSRSGFGCGTIVVWGDTSGSIGSAEVRQTLAELSGILDDLRPSRLVIAWCDAAIYRIDEVTDASDLERIFAEGVDGGGGTDVAPVFEWIASQMDTPDAFIGITDGYVGFPSVPPEYPVLWAVHGDNKKFPWGEVIPIEQVPDF